MNEKLKDTLSYIGSFALGSILTYGLSKHLGMGSAKRLTRKLRDASRDISTGTRKVDDSLKRLQDLLN